MPAHRAFAVYRRYYGFVRHALLRSRVAEADVDDAVHEVFIVLLRKLGTDAGGDDLRAWLFEVSRRIAANRRRAWQRHERKRNLCLPPPSTACPEDAIARREAAQRLAEFLASLDPGDRSVFQMAEIEGVPGRVVAERLGIQLHTAYRRMRSVRERFEATFGGSSRRASPLRSVLMLPSRLVASGWGSAFAPAMLGFALLPGSAASTPARGNEPVARPERAALVRVPGVARIDAGIDEPDEIVLLDDEDRPQPRDHRRRRARPQASTFDSALASAMLPDGLVVHARPVSSAPQPRIGIATHAIDPEPRRAHAPPGAWTGTFVDETGSPVADARVFCRRRTAHGGRRRCYARGEPIPRTDAHGRVTIRLQPGTYELLPFADGELRSAATPRVVEID